MAKRITVVTGHYGSGKTEFSLQYALRLASQGKACALVDLDVANPYFRSRERQQLLESRGVRLYSNTYGRDITADLPAVAAAARAPLESPQVSTVVDAGGDDAGARALVPFRKYFCGPDCQILCVVNANRPETASLEGAAAHLQRISDQLALPISGLVCNTHMLRETTAQDILKGICLCEALAESTGIPLDLVVCPQRLLTPVAERLKAERPSRSLPVFFPIQRLFIRESWLDIIPGHPDAPANPSLFEEGGILS